MSVNPGRPVGLTVETETRSVGPLAEGEVLVEITQLHDELELTRTRALEYIRDTPDHLFYAKTDASRWSVAEAIHHVCLVNHSLASRIRRLLDECGLSNSTGVATEIPVRRELRDLDPQWVLENVPVVPSSEPSNDRPKSELLRAVEDDFESIMFFMQMGTKHDLRRLSADNKIFGSLSYYEWLYFVVVHSKTHFYQIERQLARIEGAGE